MTLRTVTLIEAPTSAGGYAPGQEDGPRALLEAGLVERLEAVGVAVRRGGQATPTRSSIAPARSLPVVDVQMAASDPLRSARAALSPLSACDGLAVHFDVDLVACWHSP